MQKRKSEKERQRKMVGNRKKKELNICLHNINNIIMIIAMDLQRSSYIVIFGGNTVKRMDKSQPTTTLKSKINQLIILTVFYFYYI